MVFRIRETCFDGIRSAPRQTQVISMMDAMSIDPQSPLGILANAKCAEPFEAHPRFVFVLLTPRDMDSTVIDDGHLDYTQARTRAKELLHYIFPSSGDHERIEHHLQRSFWLLFIGRANCKHAKYVRDLPLVAITATVYTILSPKSMLAHLIATSSGLFDRRLGSRADNEIWRGRKIAPACLGVVQQLNFDADGPSDMYLFCRMEKVSYYNSLHFSPLPLDGSLDGVVPYQDEYEGLVLLVNSGMVGQGIPLGATPQLQERVGTLRLEDATHVRVHLFTDVEGQTFSTRLAEPLPTVTDDQSWSPLLQEECERIVARNCCQKTALRVVWQNLTAKERILATIFGIHDLTRDRVAFTCNLCKVVSLSALSSDQAIAKRGMSFMPGHMKRCKMLAQKAGSLGFSAMQLSNELSTSLSTQGLDDPLSVKPLVRYLRHHRRCLKTRGCSGPGSCAERWLNCGPNQLVAMPENGERNCCRMAAYKQVDMSQVSQLVTIPMDHTSAYFDLNGRLHLICDHCHFKMGPSDSTVAGFKKALVETSGDHLRICSSCPSAIQDRWKKMSNKCNGTKNDQPPDVQQATVKCLVFYRDSILQSNCSPGCGLIGGLEHSASNCGIDDPVPPDLVKWMKTNDVKKDKKGRLKSNNWWAFAFGGPKKLFFEEVQLTWEFVRENFPSNWVKMCLQHPGSWRPRVPGEPRSDLEDPAQDLPNNRRPSIIFLQGRRPDCLMASLVSAFHDLNDQNAVRVCKGIISSCKSRDRLLEKVMATFGGKHLRYSPVFFKTGRLDVLKERSEFVTVVQLLSESSNTDHAVSIRGNWIFDATVQNGALPLTKENLDWCCSAPGRPDTYLTVFFAIQFRHRKPRKEWNISLRG